MKKQSRNLVIVALFAAFVAVTCSHHSSGQGNPGKPAGENDAKLKALLKEKLAIAQEVAALVSKAHQNGDTSVEAVVEANQVVGKAQLELCETNAERVAVLDRMLAQAKDFEKRAAELVKAAAGPKTTLLKATLTRLDCEVALERAKNN